MRARISAIVCMNTTWNLSFPRAKVERQPRTSSHFLGTWEHTPVFDLSTSFEKQKAESHMFYFTAVSKKLAGGHPKRWKLEENSIQFCRLPVPTSALHCTPTFRLFSPNLDQKSLHARVSPTSLSNTRLAWSKNHMPFAS